MVGSIGKAAAVAVVAATVAMTMAAPAMAAAVAATGYDMPNGDGQAHLGTWNYWDRNYTGVGSTTTDGAPLSGGQGKLTDGFVSVSPWYTVSNVAGTGDYVGWVGTSAADPTVTFHFAGSPTINDIKIQLDNTGVGGVFAPSAIWVDGINRPFVAPTFGTVGIVDLSGLNLTGGSHDVQFFQIGGVGSQTWVFVSEVMFASAGVPEPATWALMLAGFGLAGAALRRRPRTSVA